MNVEKEDIDVSADVRVSFGKHVLYNLEEEGSIKIIRACVSVDYERVVTT